MLTSRMAKLKNVVSDSNPKRVMADLSPHDIPRIKRELPKALARQKRSKSQGENIQTYYQLFNRVMVEALNDSFISTPLKLSNPATKKADNTRPFSTDEISSLLQGWPYSLNDEGAGAQTRPRRPCLSILATATWPVYRRPPERNCANFGFMTFGAMDMASTS